MSEFRFQVELKEPTIVLPQTVDKKGKDEH